MQYIEAIKRIDIDYPNRCLFLAGGITDCPDWQKEVTLALSDLPITILNPRRANFNVGKDSSLESERQIKWEYEYLRKATHTLFWFPEETLCPITLFELGSALERIQNMDRLFIGCHRNYKRRLDVEIQTELRKSASCMIQYDLDSLIKMVRREMM